MYYHNILTSGNFEKDHNIAMRVEYIPYDSIAFYNLSFQRNHSRSSCHAVQRVFVCIIIRRFKALNFGEYYDTNLRKLEDEEEAKSDDDDDGDSDSFQAPFFCFSSAVGIKPPNFTLSNPNSNC
jgi:hypothetical protein